MCLEEKSSSTWHRTLVEPAEITIDGENEFMNVSQVLKSRKNKTNEEIEFFNLPVTNT